MAQFCSLATSICKGYSNTHKIKNSCPPISLQPEFLYFLVFACKVCNSYIKYVWRIIGDEEIIRQSLLSGVN